MKSNLRTLSRLESQLILPLLQKERTEVRTADIREVLGRDLTEHSARKLIGNLVRKGWLVRLVTGKYQVVPPERGQGYSGEKAFALAAAVTEPSYIGWWSAASWHGFTSQKPKTIFVAVTRQSSTRQIEGASIRFVSVTTRKFFGFDGYDVYGRTVLMSSPAKTLVDCLDRPDLAGGPAELTRIVHAGIGAVDPEEMFAAAKSMRSKAMLQRLGFLSDLVGRPLPLSLRTALRDAIPRNYRSHFGRAEQQDGDVGFVAPWGLFVNAPREQLLAEASAS